MQDQWLAKVKEGREHTMVGLTVQQVYGGRLSPRALACIVSFAVGGDNEHVQSCLSQHRVATALPQPLAAGALVKKSRVGEGALQPRLALVSYALALSVFAGRMRSSVQSKDGRRKAYEPLRDALGRAEVRAESASGGKCPCVWLRGYFGFLRGRCGPRG